MKTSERARIPKIVPAILAVLILIAATAAGNAAAQTGPPTAPSTPMNPAASLVLPESGDARVRIAWDNPQDPGITGYTIARSDGTSADSPGQATTYTDESALPGSSYTYTVTARSAGGDSPASEAAGIDLPDPPPEAQNVSAAVRTPEAAHGSVHVTLTWDSAPEPQARACEDSYPVTQYRVSRSAAGGAPVEIAVVPEGASPSHTDEAADFNTAYTYHVEAVSRIGRGAPGAAAVDTPKRPIPPPTELDVDEVNTPDPFGGTVVIDWTAPEEGPAITGYRITRQDPGAEPHVLVENTESADTAHTDSGLSAGLTYVYTVAALSTDNASPESGPLSVWAPLPALDPAARADTDHIDVSWTAPEETTRYLGYIVRRREAGQADWAILSVVESLEYADRPDPLNPLRQPAGQQHRVPLLGPVPERAGNRERLDGDRARHHPGQAPRAHRPHRVGRKRPRDAGLDGPGRRQRHRLPGAPPAAPAGGEQADGVRGEHRECEYHLHGHEHHGRGPPRVPGEGDQRSGRERLVQLRPGRALEVWPETPILPKPSFS